MVKESRAASDRSSPEKRKNPRTGSTRSHKGGKQSRQGKRHGRPRIHPKLAQKARELSERTGLGTKDALRVARGQVTVQQVLKEMLVREKLKAEVERGDLDPMYIPSIISGQMPLERAKRLTNLLRDDAWRSTASILDDMPESGEERVFFLFGRNPLVARVPKITKYDVWLQQGDDRDPEQTEKHNIILSCRVEELDNVISAQSTDMKVAELDLGPSSSYKDRFRSDKEILYDHHLSGAPIRVTFRNGMVLEGQVGWFGRWEFELIVSKRCRPVLFRHAMYALEDA